MNWVDIILILLVFVAIAGSVQRGFIIAALELLSWAGSLALAFMFYRALSNFIDRHIVALGPWTGPLSFMIIVVAARVLLTYLEAKLLEKVSEKTQRHPLNKLLGIIPGVIYGMLWALITATLLILTPIFHSGAEREKESILGNWIVDRSNWFKELSVPVFADLFQQKLKENAAVGKAESISLPFKVKNAKRRSDLEAEMLTLINSEREKF